MSILEHREIKGSVEYDVENQIFYGKLLNINGTVMYEAVNSKEFFENFKGAVDEYIEDCEENGIPIKKEFKGSFNVRTSPEMHEALYLLAIEEKTNLNSIAKKAFESYIKPIHNLEKTKAQWGTMAGLIMEKGNLEHLSKIGLYSACEEKLSFLNPIIMPGFPIIQKDDQLEKSK